MTGTPAGTPALAGPLRAPMAVAGAGAVSVFSVLAVRFAGDTTAGRLDRTVGALVEAASPEHSRLFSAVIRFGFPASVVVLAGAIALLSLALRRPRLAVVAIAGPGLTGVVTTVLKPLVGRTIQDGLAYPSGHTGGATSLGVVIGLLLVSLLPVGRLGAVAVVASTTLLAGTAMALSLVHYGIHYPTDTVGGFCAALAAVSLTAWAVDGIADWWRARRLAPSLVPPGSTAA